MAADAKILDEDAETGAKKYRYIRTGADHFSLAFTYALMAVRDTAAFLAWLHSLRNQKPGQGRQNPAYERGFYGGDADPRWARNPVYEAKGFW